MQQLHDDLGCYPVQAIEYALDAWGRNSKVLPALADLLQLLRTWQADVPEEKCDCAHRHGKGYGVTDILWIFKRRKGDARWSIQQYEEAFDELDKIRDGGAPEWRRTPDGRNFLREA